MIFKDIAENDTFSIPSGFNHEMENFKKLRHNRAKSLSDNRVVIFGDEWTVWEHSFATETL